MIVKEQATMSEVLKIDLYPQTNKNVFVEDKMRIMNNERLAKAILKYNSELSGKGRLMIRASGTEPKIRIMVESKDAKENEIIANAVANLVKSINEEV